MFPALASLAPRVAESWGERGSGDSAGAMPLPASACPQPLGVPPGVPSVGACLGAASPVGCGGSAAELGESWRRHAGLAPCLAWCAGWTPGPPGTVSLGVGLGRLSAKTPAWSAPPRPWHHCALSSLLDLEVQARRLALGAPSAPPPPPLALPTSSMAAGLQSHLPSQAQLRCPECASVPARAAPPLPLPPRQPRLAQDRHQSPEHRFLSLAGRSHPGSPSTARGRGKWPLGWWCRWWWCWQSLTTESPAPGPSGPWCSLDACGRMPVFT